MTYSCTTILIEDRLVFCGLKTFWDRPRPLPHCLQFIWVQELKGSKDCLTTQAADLRKGELVKKFQLQYRRKIQGKFRT